MSFWDSVKKIGKTAASFTPVGMGVDYINNRQGSVGGGIRGAVGQVPLVGNIQNKLWGGINGSNSNPQDTLTMSQGYNEPNDIMNQIKAQKMTYNPVVGQGQDARLSSNLRYSGGKEDLASMLSRNQVQENFGRDNAMVGAQGALDQSRANASMRGGYSNPALAQRSSMRDMLMAQQSASKDAMLGRNKIYDQAMDVDNKNADKLMGAMGTVNQYDQNKTDLLTKLSAAKMQADATRASGGKSGGGFLGIF